MPLRLGLYPYLNMLPYRLPPAREYRVVYGSPREVADMALRGELDAAIVPIAAFPELAADWEPLGPYGIATRHAAQSVLLFARRPIESLHDARIYITPESRTSVQLLHILLHLRYRVDTFTWTSDPVYSDAALLIGNRALQRIRSSSHRHRVYDLGREWTQWQRIPLVFARWLVRKDLAPPTRTELGHLLGLHLETNLKYLQRIVREGSFDQPPEFVLRYLSQFLYRIGPTETTAIERFLELAALHTCHSIPHPVRVGATP